MLTHSQTDFSTWSIMVVDDEPDNLELVMNLLEFKGATVEKALDASSGLKILETFKPTIILLDLAMPQMDGWEMHKLLRGRPELANVPIVALSAHAMSEHAKKVEAAGFDGYIIKPFRIDHLLDQLIQCVEKLAKKRRA